jgi:hypothetical protein
MVNLPIEYSDKQVTPFGGMSLMKRFLDQTNISSFFQLKQTAFLFQNLRNPLKITSHPPHRLPIIAFAIDSRCSLNEFS